MCLCEVVEGSVWIKAQFQTKILINMRSGSKPPTKSEQFCTIEFSFVSPVFIVTIVMHSSFITVNARNRWKTDIQVRM